MIMFEATDQYNILCLHNERLHYFKYFLTLILNGNYSDPKGRGMI